jgi:hypothetical protein
MDRTLIGLSRNDADLYLNEKFSVLEVQKVQKPFNGRNLYLIEERVN